MTGGGMLGLMLGGVVAGLSRRRTGADQARAQQREDQQLDVTLQEMH
jgi:hypothetical protein